jgi:hypothetical protein
MFYTYSEDSQVESMVKESKLIETEVEETVNETEEAQESGSNAMDFGDSFSIDFQDPQRGDGLQARNPREPPMDVAPSPPVKTASKRSSGNRIPRMTRSPPIATQSFSVSTRCFDKYLLVDFDQESKESVDCSLV